MTFRVGEYTHVVGGWCAQFNGVRSPCAQYPTVPNLTVFSLCQVVYLNLNVGGINQTLINCEDYCLFYFC